MPDESPRPTAMNASRPDGHRDLRSPAELELRRSRTIHRVLAEATGSAAWVMPPSGGFESEEPGWEALTGQPFAAYQGSGWLDALHPDDRPRIAALWGQAVGTRTPYTAEYRLRGAGGHGRTVVARAEPVSGHSGDVVEWIWVLTDVTEQRQVEHALRTRTAELQALTDNATDVIARVGPDLRYRFVNPAIESATGLTPEAVIGRTIAELGIPEARAKLAEAHIRDVFETGRPFRYEFVTATPAGPRSFIASLAPEREADGGVGSVLIITSDITEVRAATRALHASEEHLRQILESVTDAFFALDVAGRFTYVNGEAERFLGRSRADLLGRNILDVMPEVAGTVFESESERARRDGVAVRFTAIGPTTGKWSEVRVYPDAGRVSVFFTDITERRERQARLHLLRQAVEASANGIVVTDSAQADNPIIYVNPAFTAITGYLPDEVMGLNCRFLQGDDHEQEGLGELRRALAEQRATSVILHNYRKDGSRFCNELHVAPVEAEDGVLLNHVGIMTDVTDRVASEQRQRESAEALRALTQRLVDVQERERHALALELHDEIGQTLTALKFTLDHVDRATTVPAGLLSGAREMVRGLQDQVRNLSLGLRPSMLDDFGLVPALVWLFGRVERHMGLTVRFTPPALLPILPTAVATAAYRIVQEALTNVVRHAGVSESDVALRVDDGQLVIEIADRGTGVDLSLARTTTGLSGMRERAFILGGSLALASHPGGGMVVRACLPLLPRPALP